MANRLLWLNYYVIAFLYRPRDNREIHYFIIYVSVIEARIFRIETVKTPNCIAEWQMRKPDFSFAEKPDTKTEKLI